MFAGSDHLLGLYQLELGNQSMIGMSSTPHRRDAQLFNMHTQAFLATPVKTLPARWPMPSFEMDTTSLNLPQDPA